MGGKPDRKRVRKAVVGIRALGRDRVAVGVGERELNHAARISQRDMPAIDAVGARGRLAVANRVGAVADGDRVRAFRPKPQHAHPPVNADAKVPAAVVLIAGPLDIEFDPQIAGERVDRRHVPAVFRRPHPAAEHIQTRAY